MLDEERTNVCVEVKADSEFEDKADFGDERSDDVIDDADDEDVEGGEHRDTCPKDDGKSGIKSFHVFKC